ncbi:MAG: hypothetical protein J5755_01595, partial [Clostridia bacterium]|nr:hypothetical protein [Clostridia bacterium]
MKKPALFILILSILTLSLAIGGGSAFADRVEQGTGRIDAASLLERAGVELLPEELPYLEGLGVDYDARIPSSAVSIHSLGDGRVAVVATTYQRGDVMWV